MPSPSAGSRSSADLPPGTLIAGFRLGRVIGRGSRATVYEATQLSLDRRVAFKLVHDRGLADRVRTLSWPEHPGAVSLFGAGDSEHGPWLAMRLVPGGTLATRAAPLDQVAAALDRAHAQGIVHGDVSARNVLVADGRAHLSDFGLGPETATADDDRAALARLVREHPPPATSRRRVAVIAVLAGLLAAAVLAFVLGREGDGGADAEPAPRVPPGTRAVGSALAPGDIESVDCNGRPPGGSSPLCTLSQIALAGRPVVVPIDGTIRSWAVRGASGSLALQVLRGGPGRLIQVARSPDELVRGPGVHVVAGPLPVEAGDRIGLLLPPESAIGVRRGVPRTTTERWFGPLIEPPRPPERPAGSGLDAEVLLRVAVSRAGRREGPVVRGAAAARAPRGRELATRGVPVAHEGNDEILPVTVVVLARGVALDLFQRTRRLARAPLTGADPRGRLRELSGGTGYVRVRWRNPDGRELDLTTQVTQDTLS
jgi:Protein kinase domain